jgi:hypothetical protein
MTDDAVLTIRSFHNSFNVERRIHRIDRWQIPVPFGIPVRGIGYAIVVEAAILLLSRLPALDSAMSGFHPALRFVVLPTCLAFVLTRWEIDGRAAHTTLRSLLKMLSQPTRLVAWQRVPEPGQIVLDRVTIAADERSARLRPAEIRGPALVLVRYPFSVRERRRALQITQQPGPPQWRGKEISLRAGQRVVIR